MKKINTVVDLPKTEIMVTSEDDFVKTYKPMPAPPPVQMFDLGSGAILLDPHEPKHSLLLTKQYQQGKDHIWTLVEEDGIMVIISGYHYVNRMGYIITEVPWNLDNIIITLEN